MEASMFRRINDITNQDSRGEKALSLSLLKSGPYKDSHAVIIYRLAGERRMNPSGERLQRERERRMDGVISHWQKRNGKRPEAAAY